MKSGPSELKPPTPIKNKKQEDEENSPAGPSNLLGMMMQAVDQAATALATTIDENVVAPVVNALTKGTAAPKAQPAPVNASAKPPAPKPKPSVEPEADLKKAALAVMKPEAPSQQRDIYRTDSMRVSNGHRVARAYLKVGQLNQQKQQQLMDKYKNEAKIKFSKSGTMLVEPTDKMKNSGKSKEEQLKSLSSVMEKLTGKKPAEFNQAIAVAKNKISSRFLRASKQGFKKAAGKEAGKGAFKLAVAIKVGGKRQPLSATLEKALCAKLNAKYSGKDKAGKSYSEKFGMKEKPKFSFKTNKNGKRTLRVKANCNNADPLKASANLKKLLTSVVKACNNGKKPGYKAGAEKTQKKSTAMTLKRG